MSKNLPGEGPRRMTSGPVPWPWIIATLVGGIVLRALAYLAFRHGHFMAIPGFEDAVYQARWSEMSSGGFPETVLPWGSPVYPYLLQALSQVVGQSIPGILVIQSMIGLGIGPLLAWTLRPILIARHCWMAAFIYAIHPLGLFFEWRLQPIVWALALLLIITRLLFLKPDGSPARSAGGGVLLGLGFLFRPLMFLLFAAGAVYLRLRSREHRRAAWLGTATLLMAALVLPVIFCAHNGAQEEGAFTWNWSDSFFFNRTFESDTGGTARSASPPAWTKPPLAESIAQQAEARTLTKPEMRSFFVRSGLRALIERPTAVIGSILGRGGLLLSTYEIPDPVSPYHVFRSQAKYLLWGLYLFPLLLGLGMMGLWTMRSEGRAANLVIPLLMLAATNLLGVQSSASRWPLVVLLLPAVVVALAKLPSLLPGRHPHVPRWLLPGAVLLIVLSALDLPRAQARFGDRSEDLREEALLHLQAEDTRGATRLLREAIHISPQNPNAHTDLAGVMRMEELSQAARDEFEQALELDPECEPAIYGLAELLRAQKSFTEAESLMLRLVSLHPNHPLYWNELGAIATQLNKFPQARMALDRALQLYPEYQAAKTTLKAIEQAGNKVGEFLLPSALMPANDGELATVGRTALGAVQANQPALADSVSAAGLASFPDQPFAWYVRGAVLISLHRPEEALELLQRTAEVAPGRFFPTSMVVQALGGTGRIDEAKAFLLTHLEQAATENNRRKLAQLGESMGLQVQANK